MRELLSSDYFPFGSQYYRAPSPPEEDWDRDLKAMADLGFNSVKFWIQWRWNHPAEDRFYWEDIDGLMDLSSKHGLKVMLNTIVDVAPAWIYRKHPDAAMLTLDGRRIGPQTQSHRQIGGLGLCLNHEDAVEHMMQFLRAAFERYSDHAALEIWNFGSEPELTQSMSEMRLWADDAKKMGDMLCHCHRCAAGFRQWLSRRYSSIDELNQSWNRNYDSFEDAELPMTRNTFNDVIDWRMFFVDMLGNNVRRRYEIAREVDDGRHPVMCHHVFIQGFPLTSTANDPWNVAQYGDLHGFTQMDDPMMHDILRSCARGKPVISAEMLMLMGYTLDLHETIDSEDVKRHIFTGIAANLKGFIFWQYRPELLGREAPAWGLTRIDGSTTPWLEAFAECGRVLQDEQAFLFAAAPPKAEIALLYNPENQVFAWASTGNEKTATDSLLGMHRALYERSHRIDFLHPRDIDRGYLSDYKVVVVPFPYLLSAEIAAALRDWVENGGVLIGEAYFGGWIRETGRHATTVPGYGLHDVFGVSQENAEPAKEDEYVFVSGMARHESEINLHDGINETGDGLVGVQPAKMGDGIGRVKIVLDSALPGAPAGMKAYGAIVKETYVVEDAEVLARYTDGRAAITRNSFGSGKAILIGSFLGLAYHRQRDPSTGVVLSRLLESASDVSHPIVHGRGRVRVDTLSAGDEHMIIVQNLENEPSDVSVELPGLELGRMREVFAGTEIEAGRGSAVTTFALMLDPREVRVYRA